MHNKLTIFSTLSEIYYIKIKILSDGRLSARLFKFIIKYTPLKPMYQINLNMVQCIYMQF